MKKTLRLKFLGACFLALFTTLTAFSIVAFGDPDPQDVAGTKGGGQTPAPQPSSDPAGGGPVAAGLFLAGAATLRALQRRRNNRQEHRP